MIILISVEFFLGTMSIRELYLILVCVCSWMACLSNKVLMARSAAANLTPSRWKLRHLEWDTSLVQVSKVWLVTND